ncbi:MAG TPA: hypothetical protein VF543_04730 [Pyrinomonadaceae bacterium]
MSRIVQRVGFGALLLLSSILFIPSTAPAQTAGTKPIYRIEFKPGARATIVEGTVTQPAGEGDMHNSGSERYTLRVRGGQTLRLEITSDNNEALFSLSTPDFEIVDAAAGVKRFYGKLRFSGDYYITVFARKSASRFKLKVTLR